MSLCKAILAGALLVAAMAAQAEQPAATYIMHATGEIQIAPDGHVSDYQLRSQSQLPETVAAAVDKSVRRWTFEPIKVDGRAVTAKTALDLELKAEPLDHDQYQIRIASVHFGGPVQSKVRSETRFKPPHYPLSAVRAHVGGKVLLAVHLDETGKVIEALPYQTSLDVRMRNEQEAQNWRKVFENASITAVKGWQYDITEMVDGKPVGTSMIVPMEFYMDTNGPRDGHWKGYIPGPINLVPWAQHGQLADNQDLSNLKDGEVFSLDSRFKLKDEVVGKIL